MRAPWIKIASILAGIFAALAPALWAGQDWVALKAVRVAEAGSFQASLGVAHSVQESWALGNRFAFLRDADGIYKLQRRVDLQMDLAWQWNQAWGLKLGLPYELMEFSPYPPVGAVPNFRLDDPGLRRTDGLGDVSLDLRRAWGPEPGSEGFSSALWFNVAAPTGIGPFEASTTLAATGEGRWQLQPGLVLSFKRGAWAWLMQASAPVQLGRESTVSSRAVVGFGEDGPQFTPGGNVWLGPRYGAQGAVGLSWDWYAEEGSRHSLGIELSARHRGPLDLGGVLTPDTEQDQAGFIPQLQSHFGRFHALAAWNLPLLYGNNVAASYDGGSYLRVDYGF
jgi:hypothetical protein